MTTPTYIYLASQSPRRRDLLKQIGINFQILLLRNNPNRMVDVDETPLAAEAPDDYVQRVCRAKVTAAWDSVMFRNLPHAPVLAADTTIVLGGKLLGKPSDKKQAAAMLRQLSGQAHQVYTAVAVKMNERVEMRLSKTEVTMAELSDERIQRYIMSNESHDKAGAYGIQGVAGAFVERIEGSYSGVMGLPLFETTELLRSFDCPTP